MYGTLRFFLAINVVAFHLLKVANIGPMAVYTFFILSGYLMTLIMHKSYGYSINGLYRFTLNRILRIYPIYWIILLSTAFLITLTSNGFSQSVHPKITLPNDIESTIANVLLIYPYLNPVEYPIRVAPSSWALTIELFFYLLIGLGISKSKKACTLWLSVSLFIQVSYWIIFGKIGFAYGNIFLASLPFSLGACLFHYRKLILTLLPKVYLQKTLPVLFLYIANLIFSACSENLVPIDEVWKITLLCDMANIILSVILITNLAEIKANKMQYKIDKFLGDLSYPIYLFHWTAALLILSVLNTKSLNNEALNIYYFAAALAVTLTYSIVLNTFIIDPIEKIRGNYKKAIQTTTKKTKLESFN